MTTLLAKPLKSLRVALGLLRGFVERGDTESALKAIDLMDTTLARASGIDPKLPR